MKAQEESQDNLADMVSLFVEYVKGIPVLKVFGGKGMFRDRLDHSVGEFGESSKNTSRLAAVSVGRYTFPDRIGFRSDGYNRSLVDTAGGTFSFRLFNVYHRLKRILQAFCQYG